MLNSLIKKHSLEFVNVFIVVVVASVVVLLAHYSFSGINKKDSNSPHNIIHNK